MLQSADILNIYMSDVMSLVVQFILVVCELLGNCFHSGSSAPKTVSLHAVFSSTELQLRTPKTRQRNSVNWYRLVWKLSKEKKNIKKTLNFVHTVVHGKELSVCSSGIQQAKVCFVSSVPYDINASWPLHGEYWKHTVCLQKHIKYCNLCMPGIRMKIKLKTEKKMQCRENELQK